MTSYRTAVSKIRDLARCELFRHEEDRDRSVAREIEEDNDAEVEALLNSERERMNREKEEVAHLEMVLDALYMTEDTMSLLRATLLPGTMSALGEARHFIRLWREQLLYQIDDDNYDHWLYRTHKEMQERGEDLDFPRVPQSMDSLRRCNEMASSIVLFVTSFVT